MQRSIVNFLAADEGVGLLAKAVPRIDQTFQDYQQWDLDFVFEVNEQELNNVGGVLPKVDEYFTRARDGKGSATITLKPAECDIKLNLYAANNVGHSILEDVAAEIRQMKMVMTEKNQIYTAKVRISGLKPEAGAMLLQFLGKDISIHTQPMQLQMDFGDGAPIGAVVCATDGVDDMFGVLQSKEADGTFIIDDFGSTYTANTINAAIQPDVKAFEAADNYADEVAALGFEPTWRDLIVAMGGGDGTLTESVVKSAIEAYLPAEAGSSV